MCGRHMREACPSTVINTPTVSSPLVALEGGRMHDRSVRLDRREETSVHGQLELPSVLMLFIFSPIPIGAANVVSIPFIIISLKDCLGVCLVYVQS